MRKLAVFFSLFIAGALFLLLSDTNSFSSGGCDEDCKKCHTLSTHDVNAMLKKINLPDAKIIQIQPSPVKSLWEVSIDDRGNKGIFYVDFSKRFIIPGPILEISTGDNKTQESVERFQERRKIDVSKIPLSETLTMGKAGALKKVIVFTDPDCPFCGKLHHEMKKVAAKRKDIVFHIKLFPLKMHKDAYWKSKSIVCSKSLKLLEDNFEGKAIPKTECDTNEIDENIKIAESLGITGTPTIILPDGRVHSGMLPADKLIKLIDGRQ